MRRKRPLTDEKESPHRWAEIKENIKRLATYAVEKNTKVEIKKIAKMLLQASTDYSRLLELEERTNATSLCAACESQKAVRSDAGTQTQTPDERSDEEQAEMIQREVMSARSADEVLAVAKKEWPQRAYKKTELTRRGILSDEAMRALVVVEGSDQTEATLKQLEPQFSGLRTVRSGRVKAGQLVTIKHQDDVQIDGKADPDTKAAPRTLVLSMAQDTATEEDKLHMYEKIVSELQKHGSETVTLQVPASYDVRYTRKLLEILLRDRSFRVLVCDRDKAKRPPRQKMTTIVIKGQSKSYAEALAELKEVLPDPTQEGVAVQRVAQTKGGGLEVRIRETRAGSSKEVIDKINRKEGLSAEVGAAPSSVLLLRDIDDETSQEDIVAALRAVGVSGLPQVDEIRRSKFGSNSAKVLVTKQDSDLLLQLKYVRVGWIHARVSQWIMPDRCYKCQKYGHRAPQCEETARQICYKCGSPEHQVKDCQEEARCYVCDKAGHRASSMLCPKYRECVEEMKKKATARNE